MPIVIDPSTNTEREVDLATYKRMRQSVESESQDSMLTIVGDASASMPLWDCVTDTWTSPIPKSLVYQHYIRKIIFKCSSCPFNTTNESEMNSHIPRVRSQVQQHIGAEVMNQISDGTPTTICTGCGQVFQLRKNQGRKHLQEIEKMAQDHVESESVFMHRFSLTASEPTVIRRVPLGSLDAEGLSASTVEQRSERPKRRRRRGRSKGRLE